MRIGDCPSFYSYSQTKDYLRVASEKKDVLDKIALYGSVTGSAIGETIMLLPRCFVGKMPAQSPSQLSSPAWGWLASLQKGGLLMVLNKTLTHACQIAGGLVGGALGALTCWVGVVAGYEAKTWVKNAAAYGCLLGCAIATFTVGLLEIGRGFIRGVLSEASDSVARSCSRVARTLGSPAAFLSRYTWGDCA